MVTPTRKLEAVVPPTDDDGAELWATFYTFRIEADGSASFPFVSHTCAELFGFSAQEAMRDVSLCTTPSTRTTVGASTRTVDARCATSSC